MTGAQTRTNLDFQTWRLWPKSVVVSFVILARTHGSTIPAGQPEPHLISCDEVEGGAFASEPAAATDAVQVRLKSGVPPVSLSRYVIVDDERDLIVGNTS